MAGRRPSRRKTALTPEAIEVALAWDTLPLVAQQHVLDVIAALRRLEAENAPIASRLFSRADPKRVKTHERRIERYQTASRRRE